MKVFEQLSEAGMIAIVAACVLAAVAAAPRVETQPGIYRMMLGNLPPSMMALSLTQQHVSLG